MDVQEMNIAEEVEYLVRQDPVYMQLLSAHIACEDAWLAVMETLPQRQAETIYAFIASQMELLQRKAELIYQTVSSYKI